MALRLCHDLGVWTWGLFFRWGTWAWAWQCWHPSRPSSRGTIPCQSEWGAAVMVMRKLGPCSPGLGTGIKFLITSQIMIYPPRNGCCGPFTRVQFRLVWGKNPRFETQMSKPIFPAKRARFERRTDWVGRGRKNRLKRIHFKAASMHSRRGGGGEYLTFGQSWILYSWFYF